MKKRWAKLKNLEDILPENKLILKGGIIIIVVFIISSLWVYLGSKSNTNRAIDQVSEFYLQELASKRAALVSSELDLNISQMQDAVNLIDGDNLKSQASLRQYLRKVRDLLNVDKFALVDEDGIVYTSMSTSSGLSRYTFLSQDITEPIIVTSNIYGAKKQVVLAAPVDDVSFRGRKIKVCFVQLNIDEMISSLVYQENDKNTDVNLYYANGEDLTNNTFGSLPEGENIFNFLGDVTMARGYSLSKVKEDFEEGTAGNVVYTYDGNVRYLTYIPVENTNWILAVLIQENVISGQIQSISSETVWRTLTQALIMVTLMLATFFVILRENTRRGELALQKEKESGDTMRNALALARYREQEMETIHAALGSGSWTMEFDESGGLASCIWSDTFRHMIGYESVEDFPDKLESWASRICDEDKDRVMDEYYKVLDDTTGQSSYDVEYRLLTKDRGWRWFRTCGRHTRREDGTPISFFGVFVDVDDDKQAAIKLANAMEAAQQASRAKSTFLFNMSHDIRTPMNAIIGFTTLAEDKIDDKETLKNYLHKIQTSSHHLLKLINNVLDMSRVETGRMTLDETENDLGEIADNLKTIVQADAETAGLTFTVDTSALVNTRVMCDQLKLNRVLLNLTGNAIKFTPEGGKVTITFSQTQPEEHGQASYRITVADTGIGMSDEFMRHVYEPFEREQSTTVSGIEGSGLGMAITSSLVDCMGGVINVESVINEGTTFTVDLTLKTVSDTATKLSEPMWADETEREDFSGKGYRALLVEDNELNQEIAGEFLQEMGFDIDVADDGHIAVDKVSEHEAGYYDIVLMDVQMPVMNGYEATRRIRQLEDKDKAAVPIVAMTANAFEEDKQNAREAGMNGHLAKPVEPAKLAGLLAQILEEQ